MAVTAKKLKEYLRLPPDCITVVGEATVNRTAFIEKVGEGGLYEFTKVDNDWTLNGSVVSLSDYGIMADEEETEITVDYLTESVDAYLQAAKSKAKAAGIREYANNAQYDLFIMALAAMYYDNRGMTFQNPADAANAQRMIDSFVLELRYGDEDG